MTSRAVLAAALLLAVPAVAEAKPKPKPLPTAEFKATLSGSQVTTWEYHHAYDDSAPCQVQVDGYGDQSVKFSGKPFRLNFTAPPKNNPNLLYTRGRPAVLTNPNPLVLDSTAERDTDFTYGQPGPKCDGENGGGVDPDAIPPKDCGTRTGTIRARFFYDWRGVLDDAIPTDHSRDKNQLKLETYWPEYNGSESGKLDETYKNCSLNGQTWAERQGVTYTTGNKLVEKQLFNKKRKSFLVSGSYITPITDAGYNGQTILAWNLKLTRVK
jgi:hypothetical protein